MKKQEIEVKLTIDTPSDELELIALDKPKFNEEEKLWDYGTYDVVSRSSGVKFMTIFDILIKLNSNDITTISFGKTSYKWNLTSPGSRIITTFHNSFTTVPNSVIYTVSTNFSNVCNNQRKNHSGTYQVKDLFNKAKKAIFEVRFSGTYC